MKYKRLRLNNQGICFDAACSMCGKDVGISDKFCRNCGHKLSQLPAEIIMDKACEILTQGVRNHGPYLVVHAETAPNMPPSGLQDIVNKPKCLHGDCDPTTCGHCLASGACDATVLPTNPPQYKMCPFRGSGFIFCKDAR